MAFFQFGRKIELAKEYSLEEIPVFSSLTPAEQRLIEKKARLIEFKRGDKVYEEATAAEAFYVVISGRFRLYNKTKSGGGEHTLIHFYRGDHFGETSLLTGRLHSASVEALKDGIILKLEKNDFLRLVNDIPSISLYLNRSLGHRLTGHLNHATHRREVKIAALHARVHTYEVFQFWRDLAEELAAQTKRNIVIVDFLSPALAPSLLKQEFHLASIHSFDLSAMEPSAEGDLKACLVKHPAGFSYLHVLAKEAGDKKVSTLLTFLTYRFEYLLLRLPSEINDYAFKALKQSDTVYLYSPGGSAELLECSEIVNELQQGFSFGRTDIRVIVPDEGEKKHGAFEEREMTSGVRIFSLLPSATAERERYRDVLRYLAKEMSGTLLGLALGSGAAYGLAHIGVIKALEREGIIPDVVVGSSIGALVGGLWAAGFSGQEMEDVAKSIDKRSGFFKLLGFRDMSVAHQGFFKGNQITRFLETYIGDKTFRDLKRPLKIIAADLFTSEEVILESGKVSEAIRASSSIPGIFRPLWHQGRYLIDGGVIDPLPIRILTSAGVKKIIAVNVLPGPHDRMERNTLRDEMRRQEQVTLKKAPFYKRLLARGLHKVYNRYTVNIFNVIMSTIQFMEYEMAQSWGAQADILIHPIVKEAHWAEFYSPEKFIKVGEQKTEEQLDEIKRLIQE